MPSLLETMSNAAGTQLSWKCSDCGERFKVEGIHDPSPAQIETVNDDFAKHCKLAHPESLPIVRLSAKEDINQTAARILKQATEG